MESFDYNISVHLKAPIYLTNLAIPYLEQTQGSIVNVSSIASRVANTKSPFYCAAKAGLDQFCRCYSLKLAEKNVRINNLMWVLARFWNV